MFTDLNLWAVLVSGVIYFVFGGIWYAAIFSKKYQEGLGFSPEVKAQAEKDFPKALAAHLLSGLITSFILAGVISVTASTTFISGIVTGFWMWLAFAFTINLNYLMFEKRPTSLFMLNNGFFLIAFAVMGGVLAVWP